MKRLIAGAVVLISAPLMAGCGGPGDGPVPHIVAVGLEPAVQPVVTVPPIVARPTPPQRASRGGESRVVPAAQSQAVPRVTGDVWAALARCESGGNPRAVSRSGRYFGAFQFALPTWHSVGMSGNPVDHPYEVQLAAAQRLQARSGWGQWPRCSRRLGLR